MGQGESRCQIERINADKLYLLISLFIFLCLMLMEPARAQQVSSTSAAEFPIKDEFKILKIKLIGFLSTNLYDDTSSLKASSMDLWILPEVNFRNGSNISLTAILSRDISEEHRTKFSTTRVEYTLNTFENKWLKASLVPALILPTDYVLYETDSLRGGIGMTVPITFKLPMKNLVFSYKPRFTKNIHEFNVNANFNSNIEYSIRHQVQIAYNLTERIELGFVNNFVQGWTYRGTAKQSFTFEQSISYAASKNLSLELDHSNEGPAKKQGGAGSNVEVFNEHTSQISFGVGYAF